MALGFSLRLASVSLLLGACAAHPGPIAPSEKRAAEGTTGPEVAVDRAASPEPEPPSGPAEGEFLLLSDAGELTVRAKAGTAKTLARDVKEASYDAELELLWLETSTELRVYDLRSSPSESVLIASGLDGATRLQVDHGESNLVPDDGCDLPYVELDWSSEPTIVGMVEDIPDLQLTGADWLRAELHRPAREVPKSRMSTFDLRATEARVKIPAKRSSCEDASTCGAAVPFANWDIALVLVSDRMGGDCWSRTCVLHDAKTQRFASPAALPLRWDSLAAVEAGSCGPFRFDASGDSFLTERSLCSASGCEKLEGRALGWLKPGPTVGAPGVSPSE
jgi:hypothetical protein